MILKYSRIHVKPLFESIGTGRKAVSKLELPFSLDGGVSGVRFSIMLISRQRNGASGRLLPFS